MITAFRSVTDLMVEKRALERELNILRTNLGHQPGLIARTSKYLTYQQTANRFGCEIKDVHTAYKQCRDYFDVCAALTRRRVL